MGPTHHLVPNVRFRKAKSTVRVKSFFQAPQPFLLVYKSYMRNRFIIAFNLQIRYLFQSYTRIVLIKVYKRSANPAV